ncbi:unnamed protein product [Amoebophrya sp. A25]|nr:unnamed protein product [Amoebophrya sp. A25]|eukprot:GSA25T00013823001.1
MCKEYHCFHRGKVATFCECGIEESQLMNARYERRGATGGF